MINSAKQMLLQFIFFIRLFRFIEKKFIGKAIDIPELEGISLAQLKNSYTKNGKEEGGPFSYVKKIHLKKPLCTTVYNPFLEKFGNKKAEHILGEAGDVNYFYVNGYHGAGRLVSGLRSALQIRHVSVVADYINKIINYITYVKEAKNEGFVSQ